MQSKKHSLIETLASISVGFVISLLLQHYVVTRIWGIHSSLGQSTGITVLFTVASIIRSYVFRRLFNHWSTK